MEHSDSEETSMIAFKRVKCGDWESDMPRRQEELHEAAEADSLDDENEAWPVDQSIPMSANPKSGVITSSYRRVNVAGAINIQTQRLHFQDDENQNTSW